MTDCVSLPQSQPQPKPRPQALPEAAVRDRLGREKDGRSPVVAEGEAVVHRGSFPEEVTAAFAAKYTWDVTAPHGLGGEQVLIEVRVRRWLLADVAQ
ncbi:hypothetical protein SALBM311S_12307 [Streptomyces alboniger]